MEFVDRTAEMDRLLAIHRGSAGLLRRAGALARGALLEAVPLLLEQGLDTFVGRVDAQFDGQLLLALPAVGRSHRT